MKDRTLPIGYPMIHLVQWKTPHLVGKPYLSHTSVGWFRIVLSVPLVEEARQAVLRQGSEPFRALCSLTPVCPNSTTGFSRCTTQTEWRSSSSA